MQRILGLKEQILQGSYPKHKSRILALLSLIKIKKVVVYLREVISDSNTGKAVIMKGKKAKIQRNLNLSPKL